MESIPACCDMHTSSSSWNQDYLEFQRFAKVSRGFISSDGRRFGRWQFRRHASPAILVD